MELPDLVSKFKGSPEEGREYYFALEINPHAVKAAVWSFVNGKAQVVATGTPAVWGGKDIEDLVNAADTTISVAAQNFKGPQGKEPQQVVFGLPAPWISDDKILPEYQSFLRQISQKLDLKPVGFVITTDAIVHYLRATEGVPPSVIIVSVDEMNIEVTLTRLGKLTGTQIVARSVSLGQDLEEGLTRFQVTDVLPSRILLYDSQANLEEVKQQLLDHPWQEKLPFLHFPKVEILPADFSIRSVALSAASEFTPPENGEKPISTRPQEKPAPAHVVEVESESEQLPPANAEDLGFVENQDILEVSPPAPPPVPQSPQPRATPAPRPSFRFKLPTLSLPQIHLPSFKFKKDNSQHPSLSGQVRKKWPFIVSVSVIVLLGALLAGYWFLPKATVTIFVEPKSLDKQLSLTFDSNLSAPDPASHSLPSQSISIEVSGEKTSPTTGQKTVGERATGEVTIYNATPQTRTLAASTTLTSPSGLTFTLNSAVTIASESGTAISSEPGTATVKITATGIGEQSNLAANTEFKVGSFTPVDVAAKNSSALVGGSSRKVQAVAKDDLDNLEIALVEELSAKATSQLSSQLPEDQAIVDGSLKTDTVSKKFSHSIAEEAEQVSLSQTIKAAALAYAVADFRQLVEADVISSLPAGYQFPTDNLQPKFELQESSEGKSVFAVSFSANLLPRISIDAVKQSIVGKSLPQAEQYLKTLPGFTRAQAQINPKFIPTLPRLAQNIDIAIESAQ